MPNLRETYNSTRQWVDKQGQRRNPDGLGLTLITNQLISTPLIGLQGLVALEIHELSNEIDANLGKFLVITGLGIINGLSVLAETKAIAKRNYSASTITNFANAVTERPLLSALASKAVNYSLLAVSNPINLYALITGNSRLYIESTIAGSFVFPYWSVLANTGIISKFSTPMTEWGKKRREEIGNRIKPIASSFAELRLPGPKR